MRQAKILSIGFFAVLIIGFLLAVFLPKKEFSENENRYLQKFPKLTGEKILDGSFMSEVETWTTDHFPARDFFVGVKTSTELCMLNKDNTRVYFGKDGYLFEKTDRFDMDNVQKNVQAIHDFLQALQKEQNIHASVLIAPTASDILKDKLPAFAPIAERQNIMPLLKESLSDVATVTDITKTMEAHKDEYIYYRTDHHWTSYGAFLAYTQWAEENDMTPLEKSDFTVETVSDSFLGTTYSKANIFHPQPDSIERFLPKEEISCTIYFDDEKADSIYFPEYLSKKDKYPYFLGGNHPLTDVHSSAGTGRTLLMIKDSYSHCFIPFLTNHYDRILAVDPRYYKEDLAKLVKEEEVTDVMVLYNASTFAEDTNLPSIYTSHEKESL